MQDIGYKLFGKTTRTELIRFLALNVTRLLSVDEIYEGTRIKPKLLKTELAALKRAGVIAQVVTKEGRGLQVVDGEYRTLLASLFGVSFKAEDERLVNRIKKSGKIKLIVSAGRMVGDEQSPLDMLIVGDVKTKVLESALRGVEERMNAELRCAVLTETDFLHRLDMRDRLLAEVFQTNHRVLYNKTKVKPQVGR